MKASIWKALGRPLAVCAVAGTLGSGVLGQKTQTAPAVAAGSPEGSQIPCSGQPCTAPSRTVHRAIPPPGSTKMTDGQLQEMRYGLLFSEIAAQEKMAQSEEDAGNAEAAASWRAHLAKKSGLKPEEAEMVKKIGIQYTRDWWAFQAKYRDTLQAVRKAHPGVRMARLNSPEIAALEREREGLFTNMRAQLIRVLGPRSFTQLDSYTLHSHDNARALSTAKAHPQTDQSIPVD